MDANKFTETKNKKNHDKFFKIPAHKKIVVVPQCLRNIKKCKAEEYGSYYICRSCGACKIAAIVKAAREAGYKEVRILKGGSAVKKLLTDGEIMGVLGVACHFEGVEGIKKCESYGIPVYFYPLSKDGCENTDLELEPLLKLLHNQ